MPLPFTSVIELTEVRPTMVAKSLKNKKGLAVLELLILIWVMFILLGATLGSWGLIHTGILNSISARNYSFFYFNNRSDLSYLRDFQLTGSFPGQLPDYYGNIEKRFAVIVSENSRDQDITATLRKVDFQNERTPKEDPKKLTQPEHQNIFAGFKEEGGKATKKALPKAWIMVGYGICLTEKCGDQ